MRMRFLNHMAVAMLLFVTGAYASLPLNTYIITVRLDRQQNLIHGSVLNIRNHEMVAVSVDAHFQNNTTSPSYVRLVGNSIPSFIEGWIERTGDQTLLGAPFVLPAGRDTVLSNLIYIRPQSTPAGIYHLQVTAEHTIGPHTWDSGNNQPFGAEIQISEPVVNPPVIIPEPVFTPGLENSILWVRSPETYDQNAYCFDANNRTNLIRAAQRLYRSLSDQDTTETMFQGLEDGHTYGYFIKSVFPGRDTLSLFSDIVYSTQDHSPPDRVSYIEADSQNLSWQKVTDSISGIRFYRIDAINANGAELPVQTVRDSAFQTDFPTLIWSDLIRLPTGTWSFRVRAIDAVGNIGEGVVSNPVTVQGGSEPLNPNPPAFDAQGRPIGIAIRGWEERTLFDLDIWAETVKVQWARDTTAFFDQVASDRGRRFEAVLPRSAFSMDPATGQFSYVFDYRSNGIPNDSLDLNFVNGHRYYRRITQSGHDTSSVVFLDAIPQVPDCFPPGDIRNLQAYAETDDAGAAWHVRLNWDPAKDPVSGVAGYTIYKTIDLAAGVRMVDSLTVEAGLTQFDDGFTPPDTILNPLVHYRLAAFDAAGNRRSPDSTEWNVSTRALAAPDWIWRNDPTRDKICEGRMLTKKDTALLDIVRFITDTSVVSRYEALLNERTADLIRGEAGIIRFVMPDTESVKIRIRAVYKNGVKSVWTATRTILRAINRAPASLSAWNDDLDFQGNIRLSWLRSSQDVNSYLILRAVPGTAFQTLAMVESTGDTLRFLDSSNLTAFSDYIYRVRAINCISDTSDDSNTATSYCNRAPEIVIDSTRITVLDSTFSISILWTRPEPMAASRSWIDSVAVFEDDLSRQVGLFGTSETTGFRFDGARPMHRYIFRVRETALDVGEEGIDRRSAWSNAKDVSFFPPRLLSASSDSADWTGSIRLTLLKTGPDVKGYEIFRSQNDVWNLVGKITTDLDTIQWTDEADRNELTQSTGDSLIGFANYSYRARAMLSSGRLSDYSNTAEAYCNRAPEIIMDSTTVRWDRNHYDITIQWNRPRPAKLASSWLTFVKVRRYKENIDEGTDTLYTVVDQTAFTCHDCQLGMNYVFRIQERSNNPAALTTAWSMSYTEARLSRFIVRIQPQPMGRMFIAWSPDLDVIYGITGFEIKRDGLLWDLPSSAQEWMDVDPSLENGRSYRYEISGRNALGQIVLHTSVEDTCDTKAAYVPYVQSNPDVYFLKTLDVGWFWKGADGQILETGVRGADSCRIELSVSRSFPEDPRQTTLTPWFKADGNVRKRQFQGSDFPALVSVDNETLFFRITAKDPWGNPKPALWSTDFDSTIRFAVYDSVPPPSVTDLNIVSVKAFDPGSDSTLIELRWTGSGVEYLTHSQLDTTAWTAVNSNIAVYQVMRKTASGDSIIHSQPVDRRKSFYSVIDTIQNRECSWFVICVDSTGNRTYGPILTRNQWLIRTPRPPNPLGLRSCSILEPKSSGYEYSIEIAMDSSHFRIGHKFTDVTVIDTLLCRSGWIADTVFACPSGWGAIVANNTWFRIKYRKTANLESGWSSMALYTQSPAVNPKPDEPADSPSLERTFVFPNFPNPFNAMTSIRYTLAEPYKATIKVYNIAGSMVRSLVDQNQTVGEHVVLWDARDAHGRDLASGVYFIQVDLEGQRNTIHQLMKTILIR
jgi:hypothetical protein